MHRSGTSALAGTLQRLQVPLGAHLVAPWLDNPGGYFEHAGVVTVHESLLAGLGRGWESIEPLPDQWLESPAALRARDELEALVREDFGNLPLWAVKDPRLSRLLPLWHSVLSKLKIRPAHLFMLRHPDEVAVSLQQRDGMGEDYAYLLWLQHYLDAERDTRGSARILLTYDDLLHAPVPSLDRVAKQLHVRWPSAPAKAALQEILDPAQRHHVASDQGNGSRLRAAARTLFEEAQSAAAGHAEWPKGESQRALLERWTQRLAPWTRGLEIALARQRRAGQDALQQCQAFGVALERAQALSMERLAELEVRDARILSSEDMSLARLHELEALGARLWETDAALQATEAQSLARLQELETLGTRLAQTDAALQATEAQSLARLRSIESLTDRIDRTDTALAEAQSLALDRLLLVESLDLRLRDTDKALAHAQAQAHAHLRELEVVQNQLLTVQSQLILATDGIRDLESELQLREDRLQALHASLAWRLTRPLRWLGRRLGLHGHGWDAA